MSDETLGALTQRLDRLERENRWLKRIGAGVLVGLAAVVLMGQAAPKGAAKVVEAEQFVLKDASGRDRAVLGRVGDRWGLFISNAAGSVRAAIFQLDVGDFRGPALSLFDDQDKPPTPRVLLTVAPHGPSLNVYSRSGTPRAVLSTDEGDAPYLYLTDQPGTVRASLFVTPAGAPVLQLKGHNGDVLLTSLTGRAPSVGRPITRGTDDALHVLSNGIISGMALNDAKSATRASLGIAADGSLSLKLSDQDGKLRAALGNTAIQTVQTGSVEQRPESSLVLFDKEGKVIWKAP